MILQLLCLLVKEFRNLFAHLIATAILHCV